MVKFRTAALIMCCLLVMAGVASADNVHIACLPNPCTSNGTDQNLSSNPASFDAFANGQAGKGFTGDFYLLALVPNNEFGGFNVSVSGTNTENAAASPSDIGAFTAGKLDTVVGNDGFSGLGNGHPLSAYLNATTLPGVDPTAIGYEVFLYSFGDVSFPTNPTFTPAGALPVGTVFTTFVTNDDATTIALDSPNSEALLVPPPGGVVPEPRFYGILIVGLIGLLELLRRRLAPRVL